MADYPTPGPVRAADFVRPYLITGHPPPGGEGTAALEAPTEKEPMPLQAGPPPGPLIPGDGRFHPNTAHAPQPRTPLGPADRMRQASGLVATEMTGQELMATPENSRGGQVDNRQSEMPQAVTLDAPGFANVERAAEPDVVKVEPGSIDAIWGPADGWSR